MQRFDTDSEVYKMIQENRESRNPPRQSNTFKMLQEVLEADEKGETLIHPKSILYRQKCTLFHKYKSVCVYVRTHKKVAVGISWAQKGFVTAEILSMWTGCFETYFLHLSAISSTL